MTIAVAFQAGTTFARTAIVLVPGYAAAPAGQWFLPLVPGGAAPGAAPALLLTSQDGMIVPGAFDPVGGTLSLAFLIAAQDSLPLSGTYTGQLTYTDNAGAEIVGDVMQFTIQAAQPGVTLPPAPSYGSISGWGPFEDVAAGSTATQLQMLPRGLPGPVGPAPWSAPVAWAPYTSYVPGPPASCVIYNSSSYVCATAHTSGANFDATKWQELTPGGALAVQTATQQAQIATTAVGTAATAAQTATTQAQVAATQATASASSASSAQTNAAAVAALLAAFRSVFLGAFASDAAAASFALANAITLADGISYENTTEDKIRVYYAATGWGDYDANAQAEQAAAALSASNAAASASSAAASAAEAQSYATGFTMGTVTVSGSWSATITGSPGSQKLNVTMGITAPTTTVLGGVLSAAAPAHQWMTGVNASGQPTFAQPAFGDISGAVASLQLPAATTASLGAVIVGAGLQASAGMITTAQRTAISDANYSALATDQYIEYTAITAARTVTLPAASAYKAGQPLTVADASGGVTSTITIGLAPNGTDEINGSNSNFAAITAARGYVEIISNGANGWTVIDRDTVSSLAGAAFSCGQASVSGALDLGSSLTNPMTALIVGNGGAQINGYLYWTGSYEYISTGGIGSSSVTNGLYGLSTPYRIVASEFDANSDIRLKCDVENLPLDYAWGFVTTVRAVFHRWKNEAEPGRRVGFIAQDLLKAGFDELVSVIPKEGVPEEVDEDGFVSPEGAQFVVSYDKVAPILTAVIADLKRQLDAAIARIEVLEGAR